MILVTGGTGFVGKHLVRKLIERGYQVRLLVRNLTAAKNGLPKGLDVIKGDVTDISTIREAFVGVEVVINLVAIIRELEDMTFEKVNAEGTLNSVIAAQEAGVKHFIQLSALGAVDNPALRYAYSKWQGEESVRQSGLGWTIIRPSVIYGEGFGFFDRLIQSIKMSPPPIIPVPGKGTTLFQPIAVEDVVRCILAVLEKPSMSGQIYEIGGPEHLSYEQMLDMIILSRGIKRIKIKIPMFLVNIVVPIMEKIIKDPPVTMEELKQLQYDNIADIDSVQNSFGFEPKPLIEGIKYLTPAKK